MSKRRRFTQRQKIQLYVAARGLCQGCGELLGRGWHADHHVPYSRGGETLVANGRALCRTCNLKAGSRMPDSAGRK